MAWYQRASIIVASIIAVVLQIFLAPHMTIANGVPNFPVVLCMVLAILNPRFYSYFLPFVLGLVYDIVSGGPIGAMAFSLTACSALAAWFFARMNNDTIFMALANLAVGILVVEMCYGVILLISGYGTNPFDAFAFRTLPCFVYDLVLALLVYLVVSRIFRDDSTSQPQISNLS